MICLLHGVANAVSRESRLLGLDAESARSYFAAGGQEMRMPFDIFYEEAGREPATHVLIIGVSAYPHLSGGTGKLSADNDGMGQLTSPGLSARDLAAWACTGFNHPGKPLKSVSLLLSEPELDPFLDPRCVGAPLEPGKADAATARDAIKEFHKRGDACEGNLLIFYFCGHGISSGNDTALLLSDYGANPLNALEGALDFRRLRAGLARCKASEQVYFIDACRASSDTLLDNDGYAGAVLFGGGPRPQELATLSAPVFYATLNGAKAYARPAMRSVFTGALIRALEDLGAEDEMGDWRVSTNRLQTAIEHVAGREAEQIERRQTPVATDVSNIYVHFPRRLPLALVYVTVEPADDLDKGPLTYVYESGVSEAAPVSGRNGAVWELELPAGQYDFKLEVLPSHKVARNTVRPPFRKVQLR